MASSAARSRPPGHQRRWCCWRKSARAPRHAGHPARACLGPWSGSGQGAGKGLGDRTEQKPIADALRTPAQDQAEAENNMDNRSVLRAAGFVPVIHPRAAGARRLAAGQGFAAGGPAAPSSVFGSAGGRWGWPGRHLPRTTRRTRGSALSPARPGAAVFFKTSFASRQSRYCWQGRCGSAHTASLAKEPGPLAVDPRRQGRPLARIGRRRHGRWLGGR